MSNTATDIFNCNTDSWEVIKSLFSNRDYLIRHQLDSYNDFIDRNSGDGTTKYYRIGTVYINGTTLYSDFIIGKSVQ